MSDDTEHAAMTAIAFAESGGDPVEFEKILASELRKWLWSLPPATGFATLRALLKLSLGFPPHKSGVYSAGNGPCMRAPILGALARDEAHLWDLVERSSRITHSDPKAIEGAFAVALWTHQYKQKGHLPALDDFLSTLQRRCAPDSAIVDILRQVGDGLSKGLSPAQFCQDQGWTKGPSGYVVHTLGAAFSCIYSHEQDWEASVRAAVILGGDTDTVAAIVGGMLSVQKQPPPEWINKLGDWPRSAQWLSSVETSAQRASLGEAQKVDRAGWAANTLRNLLFLSLVLFFGIRRLFPPY